MRRKYRPAPRSAIRVAEDGYKGHRPGSRLGKMHAIFDYDGRAAALRYGRRAGLSPNTTKSQVRYFEYGQA